VRVNLSDQGSKYNSKKLLSEAKAIFFREKLQSEEKKKEKKFILRKIPKNYEIENFFFQNCEKMRKV